MTDTPATPDPQPTQEATTAQHKAREALQRIVQWSEAYPRDVFPEPDWGKAAALLKDGGITLDAISASCMRHVVEGVGKIAREALEMTDISGKPTPWLPLPNSPVTRCAHDWTLVMSPGDMSRCLKCGQKRRAL